jgi:hypothetical protein
MQTITINGNAVPTSIMNGFEVLGVYVTAKEAVEDNLSAKYDLYIQSWDGVYAVHSINADYVAIVGGNDGGHVISLHANRKLAAFWR